MNYKKKKIVSLILCLILFLNQSQQVLAATNCVEKLSNYLSSITNMCEKDNKKNKATDESKKIKDIKEFEERLKKYADTDPKYKKYYERYKKEKEYRNKILNKKFPEKLPEVKVKSIKENQNYIYWNDIGGTRNYEIEINGKVFIVNKKNNNYLHIGAGERDTNKYRVRGIYFEKVGKWSKIVELKNKKKLNCSNIKYVRTLVKPKDIENVKIDCNTIVYDGEKWTNITTTKENEKFNKGIQKIKLKLNNSPKDMKIKYQVYIQDKGWQEWKFSGQEAGEKGKKIKAIKIGIDGNKYGNEIFYSIYENGEKEEVLFNEQVAGQIDIKDSFISGIKVEVQKVNSINNEVIWNKDKGSIKVQGILNIEKNGKLIIEQGTNIVFNKSLNELTGIIVNGKLICNGTKKQPIKVNYEYKEEAKSNKSNLGIEIKNTGNLQGKYVDFNINKKNYFNKNMIKAEGKLELDSCNFNNINKEDGDKDNINYSSGICINSKAEISIKNTSFNNLNKAIYIKSSSGNKVLQNNVFKGNYKAIELNKNIGKEYNGKNNIQILNNEFIKNNFAIKIFSTVCENSGLINIQENNIQGNLEDAIIIDSAYVSDITIVKNIIDGTNKQINTSEKKNGYPLHIFMSSITDEGIVTWLNKINTTQFTKNILKNNKYNGIAITGKLCKNIILTKGAYEFVIEGEFTISEKLVLIVQEGCTINNNGKIQVEGTLEVDGTEKKYAHINTEKYDIDTKIEVHGVLKINFSKLCNVYIENYGDIVLNNSKITSSSTENFKEKDPFAFGEQYIESIYDWGHSILVDNCEFTNMNTAIGFDLRSSIYVQNSKFKNCDIAIKSSFVVGGSLTIINSIIDKCNCGIFSDYGSTKLISSTIKNSNIACEFGSCSYLEMTLCRLTNNENGILANCVSDVCGKMVFNQFIKNKKYAIDGNVLGGKILQAQYNYWNSPNGPNYNGNGSNGEKIKIHKMGSKGYEGQFLYQPYLSQSPDCPKSYTQDIDYLFQKQFGNIEGSLATGNYTKQYKDLVSKIGGLEITIGRTYNSRDSSDNNLLGKGWKFSFECSLNDLEKAWNKKGKIAKLPTGTVISFTEENGEYNAEDSRSTLVKQNKEYILTEKDQTKYYFNKLGQIKWIKDKKGNIIHIELNKNNKISRIYDENKREYVVSYNPQGKIESVQEKLEGTKKRKIEYVYKNNLLHNVIDVNGNVTQEYGYDEKERLNAINEKGTSVEMVSYYDSNDINKDKIKQKKDINGNTIKYEYDTANRIVKTTDANNRITSTQYDGSMMPTFIINPDNTLKMKKYLLDENGMNRWGEEVEVYDELDNTTKYERDDRGNIIKQINPDGGIKKSRYDDKNNLIQEIDELGKKTFYIYDEDKINLNKKVQPLNGTDNYSGNDSKFVVTKYEYYSKEELKSAGCNTKGLIKKRADADGGVKTYTYDKFGNIKTITDEEGNVTKQNHNEFGFKTLEVSPNNFQTKFNYDNRGNLLTTTYHEGSVRKNIYDALGRKIKEISPNLYEKYKDEKGKIVTYYPNGKVKTVVDEEGNTREYKYDVYANLISEKEPDNSYYLYEYDNRNRLIKKSFKQNKKSTPEILETRSYYANKSNDRAATLTVTKKSYIDKVNFIESKLVYDYRNNVVEKIKGDGTRIETIYNLNGTKDSERDENDELYQYKYDGLNRVIKEEKPFDCRKYIIKKIEYDKKGNKIKESIGKDVVEKNKDPKKWVVKKYSYYKNGKLKAEWDNEGRKKQYKYDTNGNLIKEITNVNKKDKRIVTQYKNNYLNKPYMKLKEVEKCDIYGNDINDKTKIKLKTKYFYDKNGNLIRKIEPNKTDITYEYDNLDREKSIQKKSIDAIGKEFLVRNSKTYDWHKEPITVTDPKGNVIQYKYDSRNFLIEEKNAKGEKVNYSYDRQGRMKEKIYPKEKKEDTKKIRYTYDKMGRVTKEEKVYYDYDSKAWKILVTKGYAYDEKGNKIKEVDAEGYAEDKWDPISYGDGIEYKYNHNNNLTEVLYPESKEKGLRFTYKYEYDALGRKIKEKDVNGNIYTYKYNNTGKLISKILISKDKTIELEKNEYDLRDNLISKTDGNGSKEIIEINSFNKPKKIILPGDSSIAQNTILYQYDLSYNKVFSQDSLKRTEKYVRDFEGNILKQIECDEKGHNEIVKEFKYDENSNKIFEKDPNGNVKEYVYDELNRKMQVKTKNKIISYEYNSDGNILKETDWLGNSISYKYDNLGRLVQKTDAVGNIIEKLEYYKNGNQSKSIDALGNVKKYEYDKNKRLIATTNGEGYKVTQSYDDLGNVVSKTDARNNTTTYEHDALNRLIAVTNAKNETTRYSYDNNGNKTEQLDGKGNKTTCEYNVANKVTKIIEPGSKKEEKADGEEFNYYADGNIKSKKDKKGQVINYLYDIHGRKVLEISVDKRTLKLDINKDKIIDIKDIGIVAANYNMKMGDNKCSYNQDINKDGIIDLYDLVLISKSIGQTVKFTESDKIAKENSIITYAYDNNGNQTRMTDMTGTTERKYDLENRTISKIVPKIGKTTYTYDNTEGLEKGYYEETTTDPKGNVTKKVYDKAKRLVRVVDGNKITRNNYYSNGSKQSILYPDGSKEEYVYNKNNALKTLTNKKTNGETIETFNYTYDAAGNMTSKEDKKGKTNYSYDKLNRVASIIEPNKKETSYTYDDAGNRLSETLKEQEKNIVTIYSYNEKNRLLSTETKQGNVILGFKNYEYDNNGNVTKEIGNIKSKTKGKTQKIDYKYDEYNQLVEAIKENKSIVKNVYNGEGLRVSKEQGKQKTNYLYEGKDVILELDGNTGEEKARNVYGTKVISRKSGDTTAYYMYNGHGDVTNLIDETGKTIGSYYYDAFGKVTEYKSSIKNPYRYAGYQYDEEIEKYYLRSRIYDPNTARFMQEDSYRGNTKEPLSLNRYTYCNNNPIIYDDPTGHWAHIALGSLIGGVVNTVINAVSDYRDDGKFNSGWKSYVGAFVEGAIDGGTIAATGGTSLLADVGAGFIGNTANQLISKGKVDVKEATVAGATNLGFGLAGKGISKVKPSKVIAKSNEIVNNITAGLKQKFRFKGLKPSFAGGYGSNKGISANLGYDSAVRKNWHEAISNKDEIQKSFSFAEGNGGITEGVTQADDILIQRHGTLKNNKDIVGQSHHLNQDAAFRDVIPREEGMAIKLEGNIFTHVASPHYNAHKSMEGFWSQYRKGGELYRSKPEMVQYNKALYESLQSGGLSKEQSIQAMREAVKQQLDYGLKSKMNVPRVPGRINLK